MNHGVMKIVMQYSKADRNNESVGLDLGFGSSNFGVCISEQVDGVVNVLHAEEYARPDFNAMISTTTRTTRIVIDD